MVLHHVTQRACALVKAGASTDTQRFRRSDLHMVDVMCVPKRSENRVRESKDQDVLRRLLAEKMVDAVGLFFSKRIAHNAIKLAR